MYSNSTAQLTTLDDRAGQKRHPHTGGCASDDAVERSELEARRAWPTELAHELLESLSIRAASSKYEDGRPRCRRSGPQGRKGLPPTRRQKHKLLIEDLRRDEIGMIDWPSDESSVERAVKHGLCQHRRRALAARNRRRRDTLSGRRQFRNGNDYFFDPHEWATACAPSKIEPSCC